jgi:hypothetical protein
MSSLPNNLKINDYGRNLSTSLGTRHDFLNHGALLGPDFIDNDTRVSKVPARAT